MQVAIVARIVYHDGALSYFRFLIVGLMRKLKVGVIDLLKKSYSKKLFSRYSAGQAMSVMPQVIAAWCAQEGHEVHMAYHTGPVLFAGSLPDDLDIVFLSAYSESSLVAYALAARFRAHGTVTVLGGPHARSFPEDAQKYCDYVVGFADKALIRDILQDCSFHRPLGQHLANAGQPAALPSLQERWPYVMPALEKSFVKMIPMLGSLGCPYTCSFCIDATVKYQPLDFETLKSDLRFLHDLKMPRSLVVWHDPNFAVRFDDYMGAFEEAVPPGSLRFLAESSLSLLTESNVKRLQKNGFLVIAPGIESWYTEGAKSKMRKVRGEAKVKRVAEHVNMINSYIPFVQCNFIFGLDCDEGTDPFDLTKQFIERAPGIYPYFSILTAYGRNTVLNLDLQREGRVLNIPFHFLDLFRAMNVRPKHYDWRTFYDLIIDLYEHAFSYRSIARRFNAGSKFTVNLDSMMRGLFLERTFRLRAYRTLRGLMDTDPTMLPYLNGTTQTLPQHFINTVRHDLMDLWDWLPKDAVYHNPNAYLQAHGATTVIA